MQKKNVFIFSVLVLVASANALAQSSSSWRIDNTEWTPAHEARYEQYIARIGDAISRKVCNTVSSCMANPSINPYHSTDPKELKLYSDCADFPFFLRGYFAWKNQLPFGFVKKVAPNLPPGEELRDIRYTPKGNIVTERYAVINRRLSNGSVKMVNAVEFINNVVPNGVSSAIFRLGYPGMDADNVFSDFYPIQLNSKNVRAGTVVYDPNGHVVTIYKVTQDGRALYIDAHPDNSVTSGMYGAQFARSNPGQGAGFKNWRPIRLEGAQRDASYGLLGGKLVGAKDVTLPGYGLEQYYGTNSATDWKKSEFAFNGQNLNYYDFVRYRLADGTLHINPIDDIRLMTQQICSTAKERIDAVQIAVTAGVYLQPHPERLPKNIFGADGDWETYASPSRDARLKDSFKQLYDYVLTTVKQQRAQNSVIVYTGKNFARDLLVAYENDVSDCKITYLNSNNQPVTMNLEDLRSRMYDLSFDPYHCPELRWGARDAELATCRNDDNKLAWYNQEQGLRFQHERNTEAVMGFSLDELSSQMSSGAAQGKETDIGGLLMHLLQ